MSAFHLKDYLESRRCRINQALTRCFPVHSAQTEIMDAMNHSLHAGGKRLRPILCIAACEAVGGSTAEAMPACCALEMVHTYSLIHDDLPAMDDDQLRRGRPTCHVAFSEATAILAGDALVTKAFQILADHAVTRDSTEQTIWLRVIQQLALAAGHQGMIEGQMQDMQSERIQLSMEGLEQLHRLKTGALIMAAVAIGAEIGEASPRHKDALSRYASNIGLAFQVQDDILDIEGDPERLGKTVGTDQRHGKNTYPALLGLRAAKAKAESLTGQALHALDIFDTKVEPLRAIAKYIIARRR